MEKKICELCNKEFEYDLKVGFPRKYCPACSKIKKAEYNAKQTEVINTTAITTNPNLMSIKDVHITAQTMMKCNYYNKEPKDLDEVYECYQYFVKKLEENG